MSDETPAQQVHDALEAYGLPGGLIPANVRDATIDEATGRFRVWLTAGLDRHVSGIAVRYAAELTGVLSHGAIRRLTGVRARRMVWIEIRAIEAEGSKLAFVVGPVRRRLLRSAFE